MPEFRKKKSQRHQDQDHNPQHCLYFHSVSILPDPRLNSTGYYASTNRMLSWVINRRIGQEGPIMKSIAYLLGALLL